MQPSRTNKKCWHKAYISKTMALYETYCASKENSTDTVFCIIVFTAGCPRWNFPNYISDLRLVNLENLILDTLYSLFRPCDESVNFWWQKLKASFHKEIKNSLAIHSQNRLYRHSTLIQRICNNKLLLQFFQCICRVENTFPQIVLTIPRDIFRIAS